MTKRLETPAGVYAPRPSRQESRADSTNNAARSIIEAERKARDAKTARLRALRLAQEAVSEPVVPAKRSARKAAAK